MPLYIVLQPIKAGGKLHRPGPEPVELDASVADDLVGTGYLNLAQAAAPAAPLAQPAILPAEPPATPATEPSGTVAPKAENTAAKKSNKQAAAPRKGATKKSTPTKST